MFPPSVLFVSRCVGWSCVCVYRVQFSDGDPFFGFSALHCVQKGSPTLQAQVQQEVGRAVGRGHLRPPSRPQRPEASSEVTLPHPAQPQAPGTGRAQAGPRRGCGLGGW